MKRTAAVILFLALSKVSLAGEAGPVSMDFDNVDIRVIIKFMSELTGRNFIVDNSVKGAATVISPSKIPVDEAYKVLESILVVNGYTTVPEGSMIKVVPISEAKQINVETHIGKDIADISSRDRVITQIVPLEYADSQKLKAVLSPYISGAGYIASYSPANTLIITETSSNLSRLLEIVNDLDRPSAAQSENVHVYSVQNADCAELAKTLNRVYVEKMKEAENDAAQAPPAIVPDTSTNSLIVLASPQEYAFTKELIQKLDRRRPQVLVEALVAEISMDKASEFGLEFASAGGIVYGSSRGYAGVSAKGAVKSILAGGGLPGTSAGAVEGTKTIGGVDVPDIGALITASKDNTDINILSAPQLLATDNKEAQILVGKKIAFIKNTQVTPEGSTVRTFEYKDIGLLLRITPHIAEDDYVRLDIVQQVENVTGQSFEGAVETSKREAATNCTVKDNRTVVIGGLITDKEKKSEEKVPVLGDIPVLNLLFRRTAASREKMNLFIFITPHIIRTDKDIADITGKRKAVSGIREKEGR